MIGLINTEDRHHPGVCILSQNFIIAPKRDKCVLKIFIISPGVYILSRIFIIAPLHDKRAMKIFIIAPNLHIARNEIS